jgi:hypothetical protein
MRKRGIWKLMIPVGFEVRTAASMKMAVFFHHQGDDRPDDGGSKDL